MTSRTASPRGDRPAVEPAATDHTAVHQIRSWIMGHRLQGHRVCTGFRVDELGFSEFLPVLRSGRHSPGSRS